MKIKSQLKYIRVDVIKNECSHSGLRTPKLALSQNENNGINWVLLCCYKFRKATCYFNNFWEVMVKNWRSWPFRTWDHKIWCISRMNGLQPDLLPADTNLRNLKVTLITIGQVWPKMGRTFQILRLCIWQMIWWTEQNWLNCFCALSLVIE